MEFRLLGIQTRRIIILFLSKKNLELEGPIYKIFKYNTLVFLRCFSHVIVPNLAEERLFLSILERRIEGLNR